MIEQLFNSLSHWMEQNAWLAAAAAFGWGLLSILLSPCHLASIPLVIAYVSRDQTLRPQRAFFLSCLFSLGIFVSIMIIGIVTALCGRMLGDIGPWGSWVVAGVFIVFGLVLLEAISLPWSGATMTESKYFGWIGAMGLGLIFGAAVGPCTFAYMAPILAIVFEQAGTNFSYSALMILLYCLGHCSVIILAGTAGTRLQTVLNWNQKKHLTSRIRKIFGVLLIAVGLYLLWKA